MRTTLLALALVPAMTGPAGAATRLVRYDVAGGLRGIHNGSSSTATAARARAATRRGASTCPTRSCAGSRRARPRASARSSAATGRRRWSRRHDAERPLQGLRGRHLHRSRRPGPARACPAAPRRPAALRRLPETGGTMAREPASAEDVAAGLHEVGYLPGASTALVSFLAAKLGKPVLVEGPAASARPSWPRRWPPTWTARSCACRLRGARRGQGVLRVELPQAAAADRGRGAPARPGTPCRTTSSARSSCSRGR